MGFKTFAAARNEAEMVEDESADGFVGGVFGQSDVVLRFEVANFDGAVENHASRRQA